MDAATNKAEVEMSKHDWITAILAVAICAATLGLCYVVASYITGVWYG